MLRDLTRNMPMNDALTKILRQTFDIPDQRPGTSLKKEREEPSRPRKEPRDAPPFHPQRYPSAFRAKGGDGSEGGLKVYKLPAGGSRRSEEHTSELQSLMRISYAVFCLPKKTNKNT